MTTYYVKNGGNDSLDGESDAKAWATIGRVDRHDFQTGDNVLFKCGGKWIKQSLAVDWNGTAENNGVIGAYYMSGGIERIGVSVAGKPIFDGGNTYPSDHLGAMLRVDKNQQHITLQDLHIIRSNGYGILGASGSLHVTVQRCKIDTTYQPNILFYKSDLGTALHNEVSNGATARQPGDTHWPCGGINSRFSSGCTIKNNYVHNQNGEGIDVGDSDVVMHNLVVDTKSQGIYLNSVKDTEVAYNMVVGTSDKVYENMAGWHSPGITISVEPNTNQNCENNKIHHNIVINTYAGIRMYNPNPTYYVDYIYIYNNTFIDNKHTFNISNLEGRLDHNIFVKNNISYPKHADTNHIAQSGPDLNNWTADYNLWAIKSAPTGIWAGTHDQTGDPNFPKSTWRSSTFAMGDFTASDCAPQSGSPAIDNGADLGAAYNDGLNSSSSWPDSVATLDQNSYGVGWEIGAFVHIVAEALAEGRIVNLDHPVIVERGKICDIKAATENIGTAPGIFEMQLLIDNVLKSKSLEFVLAGGAISTYKINPFTAPLTGENMDIEVSCIQKRE